LNSKEDTALKILSRLTSQLAKENLNISEPIKNEYSFQVFVKSNEAKVSLNIFFGKKGNKIVIQGNKDLPLYKKLSDIVFGEKLINEDKPDSEPSYPYIGTDESGKGDYFGPLVIAGVYINPITGLQLKSLGIRDSKELSDLQISQLASEIVQNKDIIFDKVLISPEKYNQLFKKMGNLNRMLGWAHARVIENLLSKCKSDEVISDKFGNEKIILDSLQQKGRTVNLTQVTKAERFIAVAAASILARDAMIKWFTYYSKVFKLEIPKGASIEVESFAKKLLEKYGEEVLVNLVKHHFKTSLKVFNQ
jgi:ribonuclease HIII